MPEEVSQQILGKGGVALSTEARQLLLNVHVKLERSAVISKIRRVLGKRPDQRTDEDIKFMMQNTADIPLFAELPSEKHLELCHVLRLKQYKKGELVGSSMHLEAFYYVLSGKMKLQEAQVKEKERAHSAGFRKRHPSMYKPETPAPDTPELTEEEIEAERVRAEEEAKEKARVEAEERAAHAKLRRQELEAWFLDIDTDGDGNLNVAEVQQAMAGLSIKMSKQEVIAMLRTVDDDGDVEVSFEELVVALESGMPGGFTAWWNKLLRRKHLKEVFQMIDKDGSGQVDVEEIQQALEAIGIPIAVADLKDLIKQVSEDQKPEIAFPNFCAIMETCLESEPETTFENGNTVQILVGGCSCGDRALKMAENDPKPFAQLYALELAEVILLDRTFYQGIMSMGFEGMLRHHIEVLDRTTVFQFLTSKQMRGLASLVMIKHFHREAKVYEEGGKADTMFIVIQGDLKICKAQMEEEDMLLAGSQHPARPNSPFDVVPPTSPFSKAGAFRRNRTASILRRGSLMMKSKKKRSVQVALLGVGGYCGEIALLNEDLHYMYTVEVSSYTAEIMMVRKEDLYRVLGKDVKDIHKLLNFGTHKVREEERNERVQKNNELIGGVTSIAEENSLTHLPTPRPAKDPAKAKEEELIAKALERFKEKRQSTISNIEGGEGGAGEETGEGVEGPKKLMNLLQRHTKGIIASNMLGKLAKKKAATAKNELCEDEESIPLSSQNVGGRSPSPHGMLPMYRNSPNRRVANHLMFGVTRGSAPSGRNDLVTRALRPNLAAASNFTHRFYEAHRSAFYDYNRPRPQTQITRPQTVSLPSIPQGGLYSISGAGFKMRGGGSYTSNTMPSISMGYRGPGRLTVSHDPRVSLHVYGRA